MSAIDFARLKAGHSLSETVTRYLGTGRRRGGRTFWLCHFHEETNPSFSITPDGGAFICFACGEKGDVLDFIRRVERLDLKGAIEFLNGNTVPTVPTPKPRLVAPDHDLERRIKAARDIWSEARPPEGSPVEKYLRGRGLTLPIPPTIRHNPNLTYSQAGLKFHALVAAIQAPDRHVVGVHRIYLLHDGRKAQVASPKMSLGPVAGNAVRLAAAGPTLALAEGIESALAFQQATGIPTWAAVSASNLPNVVIPGDVRELVLANDGDTAGREAARLTAERWTREGLHVRIADPGDDLDHNDLLLRGTA